MFYGNTMTSRPPALDLLWLAYHFLPGKDHALPPGLSGDMAILVPLNSAVTDILALYVVGHKSD
jgi:hypothetical protein